MTDEAYGIRMLPGGEGRVETGPVAFGDDWPGFFTRGDAVSGDCMDLLAVAGHLEPGSLLHGRILGLVDFWSLALVGKPGQIMRRLVAEERAR